MVQQIGTFAREAITRGSQAVVRGVTSRGAFVLVDDRRVIFLSRETCPGPLTLNLPGISLELEVGARARVESSILRFQKENFSIDTNPAALWNPPARPGGALPPEGRRDLLVQVTRSLLDAPGKRKTGFSAPLAALLDLPSAGLEVSQSIQVAFHRLREEWELALRRETFPPAFSAALASFLGLGGGLTPSGDDLAAGLLLALNRWGELLAPGFPAQALNQAMLASAPVATTALSASLLECAAAGQADQRLVEALDGLVTGQPGPETVSRRLQAYGASSGLDTLVGFSLAVV